MRMVPQFRRMQELVDVVNRILREQIGGIRVVRAFVREPAETTRFEQANTDLMDTALRAGRLMVLLFPAIVIILNVSSVAVLWFGAVRIEAGQTQIGDLTAYLVYLAQILLAVMMATFMLMMIPRAAVSAERIEEVLGTASSVAPPAKPVASVELRAQVEFRRVKFQYPGAADPVLRDVSFRVTAGETQAREFVAAMTGGLEAAIAQGGTNISGGQRQRLAIARALLRQPEIYLFDESFSPPRGLSRALQCAIPGS